MNISNLLNYVSPPQNSALPITTNPVTKPHVTSSPPLSKHFDNISNELINLTNDSTKSLKSGVTSISSYFKTNIIPLISYFIFYFITLIAALLVFYRCNKYTKINASNILQFIIVLIFPYFYILGYIMYNSGICTI